MRACLNGTYYNYEVKGVGEALLLLHGFTSSKATWAPFIEKWSKHYQVIAVDLVGHGKSDSPEDIKSYKIEKVASDLVALLQMLHIEKTHVLGYSMGGRVAISLACLYPSIISSLLLESTTAGIELEVARSKRRTSDANLAMDIELYGMEAFVEEWESIPLFKTQKSLSIDMQENIRKERIANNPVGLANSLLGMGTGSQPNWWNELDCINVPVLIMCGEWDEKFCLIGERFMKTFQNAKKVIFSRAGHAIHVEQREKFDTIVMEFLRGEMKDSKGDEKNGI